ncbi:MAG: hydantoinase/oxoprolinase family protein [Eubacteriales bacterium]
MSYGIGIDTGGTYTDAVIYDFETRKILSSAKSLTTRQDLSLGICGALDGLDSSLLSSCEVVALSTTLATNACVEGRGGRAGLVLIGVDKRVVSQVGTEYGLPPVEDMIFLESKGNLEGEVLSEPDWDTLRAQKEKLRSFDSVGIVELFAMRNGAILEKQAKDIIQGELGIPAVCGHEMFSDLNSVRRGAGTLLNARLIPIISEFLEAVERSLSSRGITCPVVVVRSDGSLMSRSFTRQRPVETLLCGPAASVMGGQHLTGHPDSIIIDMGGTTTDIAVIEDGQAVRDNDGISIGGWKTYVKGLYINTFGLGGDSAVRYTEEAKLYLDSRRVMPLCIASSRYPCIRTELEELLDEGRTHTHFLHEFFILLKDIEGQSGYSVEEQTFCKALRDGPLSYRQAAAFFGDVYRMNTKRLEERGTVIRCGLTPTDIMHIRGDFSTYDAYASELGARYVARCMNVEVEELCSMVYDEVCRKLYCGIVNMLLTDARFGGASRHGLQGVDKQGVG